MSNLRNIAALATLTLLIGTVPASNAQATDASRSPPFPATPVQQARPATVIQKMFGEFAPKFVELTDDVLFADIWERPGLSKRDRSLVTVAALIAMNRPDQLRSHLLRARDNGMTQTELVEAITHLGFYAGWPSAVSAMTIAKEVLPK